MASTIRIQGLRETTRALERLGVSAADLRQTFRKVGQLVTRTAAGFVNSRTGTLAGSIRPSNTKNKAVIRAGGARVPYAGPINFGWPGHGIAAQDFMGRAVEKEGPAAVREIDNGLRGLIRKYNLR